MPTNSTDVRIKQIEVAGEIIKACIGEKGYPFSDATAQQIAKSFEIIYKQINESADHL